jgi:hypothetical protein
MWVQNDYNSNGANTEQERYGDFDIPLPPSFQPPLTGKVDFTVLPTFAKPWHCSILAAQNFYDVGIPRHDWFCSISQRRLRARQEIWATGLMGRSKLGAFWQPGLSNEQHKSNRVTY